SAPPIRGPVATRPTWCWPSRRAARAGPSGAPGDRTGARRSWWCASCATSRSAWARRRSASPRSCHPARWRACCGRPSTHSPPRADEALRTRAGYITPARRQRHHDAIVAREAELADGHADVRYSAYVTVSAPSPEALEEAVAEVTHAAHLCRLELRRLYGEQD